MANNAFDRSIINLRERPLSSDINVAQSQLDRSLRDVLATMFVSNAVGTDLPNPPQSGFLGAGLKVRPLAVPGLGVRVSAGLGFSYLPADLPSSIDGVVGLDDLSTYKPLPLLADATINGIPAGPGGGNTRTDIIEVKVARRGANPLSRDQLDTMTGLFVSGLVNKTLDFTLDGNTGIVSDPALSTAVISYKVGIVNGAAPSVTPGYVKIATLVMDGTVASVTRGKIIDQRVILHPYGMMPFSATFGVPSGAATPPTGVLFSGPPGVEMVVYKNAQPAQYRFVVYIIGGAFGASPRGNMQGTVLRAFAAGEFFTLNYVGTTFGNLNSTQVAQLAGATLAAPALAFAVGQPYMATEFYCSRQAAGVTDNAVSDPVLVDIQGFLQRY